MKVLTLAGSLVVSAAMLSAAQQLPVFRSEVNYVEVTARVVDRNGSFVDGLTAADFEIREEGKLQRVETVFKVEMPTPWRSSGSFEGVRYRPDLPKDLQVAEGRVYLLYLNAVRSDHVVFTRKAAKDFVNFYLMPEDVVALWSQGRGLMTFTNDRPRLLRAIDAFLGTNDEVMQDISNRGGIGRIKPRIQTALDWFSSVQGRRKAMLLFSAGWAGIAPVFSDRASIVSTQTNLVDRADVQIYIVDTRGLMTPSGHNLSNSPSGMGAAADLTGRLNDDFDSLQNLRWLAEDTGGFAITNHNTYRDGFQRIVEENSQYYVLGYQSSAKKRPNWDFREVRVRVTKPGLSGVKVSARKGYVAR